MFEDPFACFQHLSDVVPQEAAVLQNRLTGNVDVVHLRAVAGIGRFVRMRRRLVNEAVRAKLAGIRRAADLMRPRSR